ncbi:MAG: ferrous iron transport protein A [Thermoanaerobaculia bacterium]|nr:ferrous iron transport protein A [Thermoanaerobaculia bacterium]
MDTRLANPSPTVGSETATRLTDLRPGCRARLLAAHLERDDLALLHALGLAERSSFRLCKAGDPWIIQVRGTRIGLSQHVAELLQVEMDDGAGSPADDHLG